MNQREAKKMAWWLSSLVIRSHIDLGWPFEMVDNGDAECDGILLQKKDGSLTADGERLIKALEEVWDEMERRAYQKRP